MATSFAADVSPLFLPLDTHCMKPQGVHLKDYGYMSDAAGDGDYPDHANARHVLARVKGDETPRMPLGAPDWSVAKIGILQNWITDGFPP